uniref:Uncharacterized protein n=1 Tax=Anguilla anguilla TaxID=7936 RepID=A0A0E9RKF1_ANGAN
MHINVTRSIISAPIWNMEVNTAALPGLNKIRLL